MRAVVIANKMIPQEYTSERNPLYKTVRSTTSGAAYTRDPGKMKGEGKEGEEKEGWGEEEKKSVVSFECLYHFNIR